jgi:hypothetical protein
LLEENSDKKETEIISEKIVICDYFKNKKKNLTLSKDFAG